MRYLDERGIEAPGGFEFRPLVRLVERRKAGRARGPLGRPIAVMSIADIIASKRAAGGKRELAELELLEEFRKAYENRGA